MHEVYRAKAWARGQQAEAAGDDVSTGGAGRSSEKGEVLLRGVGTLYDIFQSSVKTLLVKYPSVQWQPDGLTIHTNKWLLGARFLGTLPISLISKARETEN